MAGTSVKPRTEKQGIKPKKNPDSVPKHIPIKANKLKPHSAAKVHTIGSKQQKAQPKQCNAHAKLVRARQAMEGDQSRTTQVFNSSMHSTNQREVVFEVITFEYYDATAEEIIKPILSYSYDCSQALLGSTGGGTNMSRILSFDVYALPGDVVGTNAADATRLVQCAVTVKGTSAEVGLAAQKNTILLPTTAPKWIKVGGWKSSTLFKDSTVQPMYTGALINLCELQVVHPSTGQPISKVVEPHLMSFVTRVACPIPLENSVKCAFGRHETWNTPDSMSTSHYASLEVVSLSNAL